MIERLLHQTIRFTQPDALNDPFEMKRHGSSPDLDPASIRQVEFVEPNTKVVNGTFEVFAANSPRFSQCVAPILEFPKEF